MQVLGAPGDDQLKQNDKAWRDVLDAASSLGIVKSVLPVEEYYTNAYLAQGR